MTVKILNEKYAKTYAKGQSATLSYNDYRKLRRSYNKITGRLGAGAKGALGFGFGAVIMAASTGKSEIYGFMDYMEGYANDRNILDHASAATTLNNAGGDFSVIHFLRRHN
jgi:hypothetical protein